LFNSHDVRWHFQQLAAARVTTGVPTRDQDHIGGVASQRGNLLAICLSFLVWLNG
jgi:hypothetical protein